ncbi:MAG: GNAT family N-acetyltransferase [Bacteroidota bacterium]|nr:GNAT family N-acetyltransferase [Bacteroidota bacterium]
MNGIEPFALRRATEHDSEFFYNVKKTVLKAYIETIWGWDEDFQRQFHAANYHVNETQIIMVNGVDAGTVEVKENNDSIFISSLYILPLFQNKKIGSRIISHYITRATEEKKRVELEVLKLNVQAQKLYKSLGFTLTERDDTKYFMFKDCSK